MALKLLAANRKEMKRGILRSWPSPVLQYPSTPVLLSPRWKWVKRGVSSDPGATGNRRHVYRVCFNDLMMKHWVANNYISNYCGTKWSNVFTFSTVDRETLALLQGHTFMSE